LKRGYTNSKDLWEWLQKVMDGKTQRLLGTITLLDEARKPALVWKFYEGWPSKWVGPDFNSTGNDVAIEEVDLCIEGLELV
jgi:phage tail-like protein